MNTNLAYKQVPLKTVVGRLGYDTMYDNFITGCQFWQPTQELHAVTT
jgi:hypothetical protein